MYEIHIESDEFRGKRTVQQHQLVNQVSIIIFSNSAVHSCIGSISFHLNGHVVNCWTLFIKSTIITCNLSINLRS